MKRIISPLAIQSSKLMLNTCILFLFATLSAQGQQPTASCAYCNRSSSEIARNGHAPGCRYYTPPKKVESTSNPTVDPLKTLNDGLDILLETNDTPRDNTANDEKKKEELQKKMEDQKIKHDEGMKTFKPIETTTPENKKEAACIEAQKEVYRLLTVKIKFENQLYDLQKWKKNLDELIMSFTEGRNKYTDGVGDDLLNIIPIEKIKGGIAGSKQFLQGEKLEKALNATKMSKATVDNLSKIKDTSGDTILNAMKLANQSYTYTGQMVESMAAFGGEKYKTPLELAGRYLQMSGSTLGLMDNNSNENLGNSFVDAVGLFVPTARLTAAATRIGLKGVYSIYTDWQIHQLSTTQSENLKAQEFLKAKIEELNKQILTNQAIVDEYKKNDPSGCNESL